DLPAGHPPLPPAAPLSKASVGRRPEGCWVSQPSERAAMKVNVRVRNRAMGFMRTSCEGPARYRPGSKQTPSHLSAARRSWVLRGVKAGVAEEARTRVALVDGRLTCRRPAECQEVATRNEHSDCRGEIAL